MMPAQFFALYERHLLAVEQSFAPMATLASIYVNSHLKEGKPLTKPEDYIPRLVKRTAQPQPKRSITKYGTAALLAGFRALAARQKRK